MLLDIGYLFCYTAFNLKKPVSIFPLKTWYAGALRKACISGSHKVNTRLAPMARNCNHSDDRLAGGSLKPRSDAAGSKCRAMKQS